MITIDGGTGRVFVGEMPLVPPQINEDFETILGWADEDAPARRARERRHAGGREAGARVRRRGHRPDAAPSTCSSARSGCPVVQEMILAEEEAGRRAALDRLLPFQQADFEGIFEAMAGLPVTIRLLDPPLHEFLPDESQATDEKMLARIRALHEANPMLGTRGCRLGIMYPEIYEMQIRAIARAARAVEERTGAAPLVEVMHPLVGFAEEFRAAARADRRRVRRGGAGDRVPRRDDDRGAAGGASRRRDRRAGASSSRSARTTSRRRRSRSRATTPRGSSSRPTSTRACSSGTRSSRSTRRASAT